MKTSRGAFSPFRTFSPFNLAGVLALAAAGQAFLAQRELPWTLWPGLALYLAAGLLFLKALGRPTEEEAPPERMSRGREAAVFVLILALAAFFRTYRIGQFPAAVFPDQACEGLEAERILDGLRPTAPSYNLSLCDLPLCYQLAGWFHAFAPSRLSLFSFSIAIGLATLPLLYLAFRELAGPRTALTALFLFAVMRWHVTYSRDAHPAIQTPFYLAGALCFYLLSLRPGGKGFLWGAVLFGAAGFYTYPSNMGFLLLLGLCLLGDVRAGKRKLSELVLPLLVFLVLASPLLLAMVRRGSPTEQPGLFIGTRLLAPGGLSLLAGQLAEAALLFNREGDGFYLHNIPGHRMLDDGTGLLFVLGLFVCVSRLGAFRFRLALLGLACLCLPGLLSTAANHASRTLGAAPFAALIAALALGALGERARASGSQAAVRAFHWFLPFTLAAVALMDFHDYFGIQARDPEAWRGVHSADGTAVGEAIGAGGDRFEYYLSPRFYGRYDVDFLGYSQRDHLHPLELPESLGFAVLPSGRGVQVALEEGRGGVLGMLRELYPGGQQWDFKDVLGDAIVHFYRLAPQQVQAGRGNLRRYEASPYGLRGAYSCPSGTFFHDDPLLNFAFIGDFPTVNFLTAHWTGTLRVPVAGAYSFLALANGPVTLRMDGKDVLKYPQAVSSKLDLHQGPHSIEVSFGRTPESDAAFDLLWEPPGQKEYEVVPYTAFKGAGSPRSAP